MTARICKYPFREALGIGSIRPEEGALGRTATIFTASPRGREMTWTQYTGTSCTL